MPDLQTGHHVRKYTIDVIAGDVIGREVMPAAIRCLDLVAKAENFSITWRERDWGSERYLADGAMMPPSGIDDLADGDGILLGAVGAPAIPDHVTWWALLIPIRREFLQYVNLRPVGLLPGVPPGNQEAARLDVVVGRE